MEDRMCDREPVVTWLSWQRTHFFLQVSVRFKKQELQMYTQVKQIREWVGYGQIHPRRCDRSCNDAVYMCWETLKPLPYCQGCASGENKEDGNSMLMLLLNCLLDKQGTVLCSTLCVYFRKGTPCWGFRGPKTNGIDGCRLNLARLNAQQVVVWKYIWVSLQPWAL